MVIIVDNISTSYCLCLCWMIKPRESRVEDEMTNINGDVLNTDDYFGTNSCCLKKCGQSS